MSNLVAVTSPTLDGVMPAPGRPDEDLVLGSGRCLLADGGPLATLRLVDSVTATTGVLVATYQPSRTNGRHEHLGLNENAQGVRHDDDFGGE